MDRQGPVSLQFVNETETVISESLGNDYGDFNLKRGLASDSESEHDGGTSKKMMYDSNSGMALGPKPGKKTKGRVKIKMEFIENKLRRYTTFSKRKTGIMKKAYELSTLTGTQVMLLVASETGHVYTFATKKLQPMITSESGKALIQTCLNSPDGTSIESPTHSGSDRRMNPGGFEETELNYSLSDEENDRSSVEKIPDDKVIMNGLNYLTSLSPKPLSNAIATTNLSPPVTMPPSNNYMSSYQKDSTNMASMQQPQPPPAHMGIQASLPLSQPPQAHTGPISTASSNCVTPRTAPMMTYLSPSGQSQNSATAAQAAKPAVSMQLPNGGFTLLPNSFAPNGPITISPLSSQQQTQPSQQQAAAQQQQQQLSAQQQVFRIQTPNGQILTIPGLGQLAAVSSQSSPVTSTPQPMTATSQNSSSQASTPIAVVSGTTSSNAPPIMYQTPQGIVYATPNSAVGSLPEGYVISLPQAQAMQQGEQATGKAASGTAQHYISIPFPVPVSLAGSTQMLPPNLLAQAAAAMADIKEIQQGK